MMNDKKPSAGKNGRSKPDLMWLSTLGINLVLASVVGVLIGHYIDKWFKTAPVFTILFFFIGTFAGFRQIYKEVQKLNSEEDSNGEKK